MRKTLKNSRYALLLLLMLSLLLVACGGDDEEEEGDDDGGNGGDAAALVQPFVAVTSTGQTLTISLPEGWIGEVGEVAEDGSIQFASNQETLDQLSSPEPVELSGSAGFATAIDSENLGFILPEGTEPSAQTVFAAFSEGIDEGVGEPSEFNVGGFSSGVKATYSVEGNNGAIYVLYSEAGAVRVTTLGDDSSTLDAIVRSAVLTAGVALPEVTIPAVEDIVPEVTVPAIEVTVPPAEVDTVPAATEAPAAE